MLQANCFVIWDQNSLEAAIIDPGAQAGKILSVIHTNNLNLRYIIHTHSHWDHTAASNTVQRSTRAQVLVHPLDRKSPGLIHRIKGFGDSNYTREVEDAERIPLAGSSIQVIHTPGHTRGSISLLLDNSLFPGDLLFQGAAGRTDLKGGSFKELVKSINQRLAHLPDETIVFPGHGPQTTLMQERAVNPFFKSARGSVVRGMEVP